MMNKRTFTASLNYYFLMVLLLCLVVEAAGSIGLLTTLAGGGPNGDLFIADTESYRIRRIYTNGTILTVLGRRWGYDKNVDPKTMMINPYGVAVDSMEQVYISDTDRNRICKILTNGTFRIVASANSPRGITVDSNDEVYFADSKNHRIRKILKDGTVITIAGTKTGGYNGDNIPQTTAQLNNPYDVKIGSDGAIYIADYGNNRIRKIANNTITTVAGNGTIGSDSDNAEGTSAKLSGPSGIAISSTGDVYISDTNNNKIRKLSTNGIITTFAGTGVSGFFGDKADAKRARLSGPRGLAITASGVLYIADTNNNRIRQVSQQNIISTFSGNDDKVYCSDAGLALGSRTPSPRGISLDPTTGDIYFADSTNQRLSKITSDGEIELVSGTGEANFFGENVVATTAKLNNPSGVTVDPKTGDLYFADTKNNRIRKITPSKIISTIAGTQTTILGDGELATKASLIAPSEIILSPTGEIYISDSGHHRIRKILTNGTIITYAGTGLKPYNGDGIQATCANLDTPYGIALNSDGELFIADQNNYRVRKVFTNGTIVTIAGNGERTYNGDNILATSAAVEAPTNIALDSKSGALYVGSSRIRKIDSKGVISTVAGTGIVTGIFLYTDGIESTSANINTGGLYLLSNGDLIFSDRSSQLIRRLTFTRCNGTMYDDASVCNGRGNCTTNDQCFCEWGYYGKFCESQNVSCFGKSQNDSLVCSGNGECFSLDNCTCFNGWKGSDCSNNLTMNESSLNSTTSPICVPSLNCSSHGECSANGTCVCYSNSIDGYFTLENCSTCQINYYGELCSTSFSETLRITNDCKGVELNLTSPFKYQSFSVQCSLLIHENDLNLFGENPKCFWKSKELNNVFVIEFGDNYSLKSQDSIRFYTSVFDFNRNASQYVTRTVQTPSDPVKPLAIISTLRKMYNACEIIEIDASSSYSPDRRPLNFRWSIIQSPSNETLVNSLIQNTQTNSSITLPLDQSRTIGDYIVRLQVESTFTNSLSDYQDFKFTITLDSIPNLSIIGYKDGYINVKTMDVPLFVEKSVSLPSCLTNTNELVKVEWNPSGGGDLLNYYINSNNDLVIPNFQKKGIYQYTFNVTAYLISNPLSISSIQLVIETRSEQLFSNLYIDDISSKQAKIIVESQDIEQSNENEIWTLTCQGLTTLSDCGSTISNQLSNLALLKSNLLELTASDFSKQDSTYLISIVITKGMRLVSSSVQLTYPKSNDNIPPLISLLNVIPNRQKLSVNEVLNLQLSVTKSDGSDLTNIKRNWLLNGNSIPLDYLKRMASLESNSLIMELRGLEEGTTNQVSLQVTDLDTGLSNRFDYSFTISKSPQQCSCLISPTTGFAMETDFTFNCLSCQNKENSLVFSHYFIDKGASIPLVIRGGNSFTTKLPYPILNPLQLSTKIIDKDSEASVTTYQIIQIQLPIATSLRAVKTYSTKWNGIQNSLQQDDVRRMIFNSAIISRTIDAMIAKLSVGRRSIQEVCLNGGTFSEKLQKCSCPIGYSKRDCSLSTDDFLMVQEIKRSLFNNFLTANQNNQMKISDTYLICQIYGLDSLLSNYDEIDQEMFERGSKLFKSLIELAHGIAIVGVVVVPVIIVLVKRKQKKPKEVVNSVELPTAVHNLWLETK
ncbi:predicted protein [Naegleria gruberi]|uniref:Predicted protein n=1 Tax=Naegleria gruberi TaxID=5762 RepID=D2VAZ1_NAEGR|nr:uncharacterized protein NAEGRDRAFT_48081 [Naegleria gruberi]EFC46165.1 predicted protein [Naegleria gruberi]|eukprot:XP_002678909.1 predicted protein [Naegleria gruberi strain NEG-M]